MTKTTPTTRRLSKDELATVVGGVGTTAVLSPTGNDNAVHDTSQDIVLQGGGDAIPNPGPTNGGFHGLGGR